MKKYTDRFMYEVQTGNYGDEVHVYTKGGTEIVMWYMDDIETYDGSEATIEDTLDEWYTDGRDEELIQELEEAEKER